ncbi:MAG: hypothetical protein MR649_07280 [Prevotella sp.]|nr:hypothetical protein [Prevotella sp.]
MRLTKKSILSAMMWMAVLPCMGESGDKYELVTSLNQLENETEIIICSTKNKTALAKKFEETKSDNTTAIEFDGPLAIENEDVAVFKFYKDKSNGCNLKYIAASSIKNYLCSNSNDESLYLIYGKTDSKLNITFDGINAKIKHKDNVIRSTEKGNTFNFGYYGTDYTVQIYKKVAYSTTESLTLNPKNTWEATISGKDLKGKCIKEVKLERAFVADGGWYTICLPFSLNANEISTLFHGAKFQEFSGISTNGTTNGIELNFKSVTATEAGKPYLMKPVQDISTKDMTFEKKVIEVTAPVAVTHKSADGKEFTFTGIFDPTAIIGPQYRILSGANGTELRIPGSGTMAGFRAYFVMPTDLTSEQTSTTKVCMGPSETTAINQIRTDAGTHGKVYNMYGQFVSKDPTRLAPGLYIIDGKKTIIK